MFTLKSYSKDHDNYLSLVVHLVELIIQTFLSFECQALIPLNYYPQMIHYQTPPIGLKTFKRKEKKGRHINFALHTKNIT